MLELNSNVYREFGDKIKKLALNELKKFGVKNAYVNIQDQGALEFTISSRLETAIKRASKEGEVC